MGLEVYVMVILTSLEAVNTHNDFGEGTSGPKGNNLPWFFLRNKQVSNYDRVNRSVIPTRFNLFIIFLSRWDRFKQMFRFVWNKFDMNSEMPE